MSTEPLPEPPPQMLEPPVVPSSDESPTLTEENLSLTPEDCSNQQMTSNAHKEDNEVLQAEVPPSCSDATDDTDQKLNVEDEDNETDQGALFLPDDVSDEADPSILEDQGIGEDTEIEDDLFKCIRLASSKETSARQQAVRMLAQCLYDLGQNCTEQQMLMLWKMIEQLTQDSEPVVRLDLPEQFCLMSGICLNRPDHMRPFGGSPMKFLMPPKPLLVRLHRRCIIPSLTILMLDQVLQVRKISHLILFRMLESRLLAPPGICKEILPTVLHLANVSIENADDNSATGDLHDQRQEAATILAKLIQFVEKSPAQKRLLPPFLKLCNDPSFHVRRACAVAMVDLCQVLDAQCIQESLLTTFLSLCDDDAWSVRKACTESFMAISCVVDPKLRLEALAPRFLYLLRDSAKWVVAAAYQNLGPFISTFADPKRTGLELLRPDGVAQEAAVRRTADYKAPIHDKDMNILSQNVHDLSISESAFSALVTAASALGDDVTNNNRLPADPLSKIQNNNNPAAINKTNNNGSVGANSSDIDVNFNSFMFWRSPLPKVEELTVVKFTDVDYADDELLKFDQKEKEREATTIQSLLDEQPPPKSEPLQLLSDTHTSACGIPTLLLEHFKQMLEPVLSRTVDCLDLPRNCAYSLPAVALALGPQHWEEHLRELLLKLSVNVQWNVRHSVASSLHSLVIIVGDRDSVKYIIPMFHTFCRDIDEVRLPLLRNLHQICAHLEPKSRLLLLHSLSEFTRSENDRMWRLRDELANQIRLIACYYQWAERLRYLLPILVKLLQDKVAQVRSSAAACFGQLIWSSYAGSCSSGGDGAVGGEGSEKGSPTRSCSSSSSSSSSSSRGISSPFEALDITLRLLYVDGKWIKWQHRQSFARLLTAIVEDVPYDFDVLEGADETKVKRATEDIGDICPDCVGLRNMAVVNKLIRPEIFALLEHRVPNVRLEVANLLAKMVQRCAKIISLHKDSCEPCRTKLLQAVKTVRDLRPPRRTHRRRKAGIFPRAVVEDDWETDTEASSPTKEPAAVVEIKEPITQPEDKSAGDDSRVEPEDKSKQSEDDEKRQERNSDSDSSQENGRKRCELLSIVGLTELPAAFAILLDDLDEDVCRVAKEAVNCFAQQQISNWNVGGFSAVYGS